MGGHLDRLPGRGVLRLFSSWSWPLPGAAAIGWVLLEHNPQWNQAASVAARLGVRGVAFDPRLALAAAAGLPVLYWLTHTPFVKRRLRFSAAAARDARPGAAVWLARTGLLAALYWVAWTCVQAYRNAPRITL